MASYLEKLALFPAQISNKPNDDLKLIVVIPCYDEPQLIRSLTSLKNCEQPDCSVEVIVVFNESESENESIKKTNLDGFLNAKNWGLENSSPKLRFHMLHHGNLPEKKAGVGLARKIGMDEAVYRFESIGQSDGIIACFDADSLCQTNYFNAITAHFENNSNTHACSIYYEHPIDGNDYESKVYEAIVLYELHLRYYNNVKRFTGFPFAFETIGSSMAVRCDAYQQQGGMNKKKAGEDFYFLNKFMPLGHYSEIKNTTVIPSPRISHRVPFGTGKAIGEIVNNPKEYLTYAPQTFVDLKKLFDIIPTLFAKTQNEIDDLILQLPLSVRSFLEKQDFTLKIAEIQSNTTSLKSFYNRFFRWFNGFLLMKFVHHARDEFYANVPVEKASIWLLKNYYEHNISQEVLAKELLQMLRLEDKK